MKRLIVPICVLLLSTATFAQTRSRTTRRGTQSSKTAKPSAPAAGDVMNGATKVADQIKNLTKFLYILGTPGLQGYYVKLVGSASGAADSEAQAGAGHFDQAGRTLLGVVNRLTDVLVLMR